MIPSIRSLSELMALTRSRNSPENIIKNKDSYLSTVDSGQRKRYLKSINEEKPILPNLHNSKKSKCIQNKEALSKFQKNIEHDNHLRSSYDLTLLARQDKTNQQDVA